MNVHHQLGSDHQKFKSVSQQELEEDFEFDFKPITSGLGFHGKRQGSVDSENEFKKTLNSSRFSSSTLKQSSHQSQYSARNQAPQKPYSELASFSEVSSHQNDAGQFQGDLSLFYQGQVPPTNYQNQFSDNQNSEEDYLFTSTSRLEKKHKFTQPAQSATMMKRFFAYVIDLVMVTFIVSSVVFFMTKFIKLNLAEAFSQYREDFLILMGVLFVGFYVIYFSVFEKTRQSTLGKGLFKLSVVVENETSPTFLRLFFRTLLGFINLFTLGLFMSFDWQDKLAKTKVIQR